MRSAKRIKLQAAATAAFFVCGGVTQSSPSPLYSRENGQQHKQTSTSKLWEGDTKICGQRLSVMVLWRGGTTTTTTYGSAVEAKFSKYFL